MRTVTPHTGIVSKTRRHGKSCVIGSFAVASVLFVGSAALAAEKAAEMPRGQVLVNGSGTNVIPQRPVEIVVVWGFRLRSKVYERRVISLNEGYSELITKDVCLTKVCGFVVTQEGQQWRASNVMSGTESELRDMQQNMEREGTTLVIVHPTGSRREVPSF
jgi:hypothetical protein